MSKLLKIGTAAMLLVPLVSAADDYQFIISGYPATNESYMAASSATVLVTATRTVPTPAQALEARYRTWDESSGIAFRSDKRNGMTIDFR